jgi:uncharacterized protein YbjT (DUF2867 family)
VRMLCGDERSSKLFLSALSDTGLPAEAAARVAIVRGSPVSPADLEALCNGAEGVAFLSPVGPDGRAWRPETHLEDVGRLVEAAQKAKAARIVYLSTLSADARSKVRCLSESAAAEKLVAAAGLTDYSVRGGAMVGRGDDFLVGLVRQALRPGPVVLLWGYGDAPLSVIYEDDLGCCLARCLTPGSGLRAGTYCASHGETQSVTELLDRLAAKLGRASKGKLHLPLFVLHAVAALRKGVGNKTAKAFRERIQLQWVGISGSRNDLGLLLGGDYQPKSIANALDEALQAAASNSTTT